MTEHFDETVPPDLDEAVRRLVEQFQPERIYLFGSRARGDSNQHSDYDLMLVLRESSEPGFRRAQRAHSVLWGLQISLEVLVLTEEEFNRDLTVVASLPATVTREGRLLYAA